MLTKVDSDEFKNTELEQYITSVAGKSTIRDFVTQKKVSNLANLIEIDELSGSEKSLENYVLTKLATATASIDLLTGESFSSFDIASIDGFKANSNSKEAVAIATGDYAINTTRKFLTSGVLVNPLWNFSANLPVYLNGNTLSSIPPTTGFVQKVGIAKHSTILYLKIEQPIYLS